MGDEKEEEKSLKEDYTPTDESKYDVNMDYTDGASSQPAPLQSGTYVSSNNKLTPKVSSLPVRKSPRLIKKQNLEKKENIMQDTKYIGVYLNTETDEWEVQRILGPHDLKLSSIGHFGTEFEAARKSDQLYTEACMLYNWKIE